MKTIKEGVVIIVNGVRSQEAVAQISLVNTISMEPAMMGYQGGDQAFHFDSAVTQVLIEKGIIRGYGIQLLPPWPVTFLALFFQHLFVSFSF